MTITQNLAAKLSVAFVAAAMIFTAFASSAKAQTTEDLQQMINDLLAQVAALQSQTGQGTTVAAGVCPYTWTRSLSSGATGMDVMKLQQFLNSDPDTRVAVEGAGSAGSETEYYGPATAAAVSKFQVKYRSDILSPVNLVNPTGYFGPSTISKANALCVAAPVVVDDTTMDDTMDDSDDSDDTSGPVKLSGEASLDTFEISDADDDELQEGQDDAEIAEVTIQFADGDAEISRMDVALVANAGNDELDPWDVFETISLWVDGDKVAEENADDRDDYLDEDDGSLRFSGLDLVGEEDEDLDVVVAATLQSNLDGVADGETWMVSVESLRFFDADGVATTENAPTLELGDTATFTIDEEGAEDELIVKTSKNDPDGTTLQLEDNSDSDWYSVFVFDLDTDDSENDIELNEVWVTVDLSSSTFAAIVDDAELVIDGVTIDDYVASTTPVASTSVLKFDVDGDVTIDAGDRVEAELMLKFNSLDAGNEGMTVTAKVTANDANNIDAEGADDLGNTPVDQLRGAATGDAHTLRTQGVDVSAGDMDANVTTGDNNLDDYATFTIEIEVTAFEQDVYISTNPATSIGYTLEDGAGSSSITGSRTVTLTSTGDEVSNTFEITEGSTETLTLEVTYVPGVANTAARMQLDTITFGDAAGTPTGQSWTASPDEDYRTAVVTIVN